jgi:diacylglycerol kinase (ATP)
MRPAGERLIKFIVNPVSGNGRTKKMLPRLEGLAKRIGLHFDLQVTQAPEHATELASEHSSEFDVVVAVGGDGTVNEVAAGAVKSKAVMGVIPTGTGNDFARALGRLKSLQDYIHRIVAGRVKSIDTGVLTLDNRELLFVNGIGIGFDAEVARESLGVHRLGGMPRYLYALVKTLAGYRSAQMRIELDDRVVEGKTFLVAIGNGISAGGGFLLTPHARLDDGLLDVCLVSNVSRARVIQLLPSVLNGTHEKHPEATMVQARSIRVKSETPVAIHRDGEVPPGKVNDIEMHVEPGCLQVVV